MKTLILLSLLAVYVRAQDFYSTTVSARSLGLGGIYVPSGTGVLDAFAANPAGLSVIGSPSIDANLTSIRRKWKAQAGRWPRRRHGSR